MVPPCARPHRALVTTTSSPPLPISAIPVERFVERLYAPLAWEATVQLGDPAVASRLVERVLHRAWDERERFATFDALFRHVQDAALSAIRREAERRRDLTRFDGEHGPGPGSLDMMAVDAVRRRLSEHRAPVATPPAPTPVVAAPVTPAPVVAAPVAAAPESVPRPAARTSAAMPRMSGAMPRMSGAMPRASGAVARPSNATPRFGAMAAPATADVDRRTLAVGGIAVAGFIVALLAWSALGGDPESRALEALADSSGVSKTTAHAVIEELPLPDGSTVRLGADASVRTNADFAGGVRALRLAGPVSFALITDSSAMAALATGDVRLLTAGATGAVNRDADGLVLVQVDSGAIVVVHDSSRVRLEAGSVTRIDASGVASALTRGERDAYFAWRGGRLRLTDVPLREIGAAARQWFGVEVRFPTERGADDPASIDVPLGARDSLVAALEQAVRATAEVTGSRVVLRVTGSTGARGGAAPSAARGPVLGAPPVQSLPSFVLPTIPPLD